MSGESALWRQTVLTALMVGAFSFPAQAGFDWTPPPAAPVLSTTEGPLVPAAPSDSVEATELSPVTAVPAADMGDAPTLETEASAAPDSAFPEELPPPATYADALGFGADIPLALALGQIIPAEFAYSFASDVHPGVKISWNGGKPWNEVLAEALAPHNLAAQIEGTIVIVRQAERTAQNNDLPAPIAESAPPESTSVEPPPVDITVTEASPSATAPVTGEGTANNYPRRTPSHRRALHGAEVPPETATGTAPPPPVIDEQAVTVEQPAQDMATADQVASYEPSAPAQDVGIVEDSAARKAPQSLEPQKISYADEGRAGREELIVPRDVPAVSDSSYAASGRAVLDPFEIRFWQANRDQNLRDVLMSWAGNSGVEVIWDSGYDYKLPHAISMHGTFPEAVTKIFSLYGETEPRPQGRLHPNLPKGPSVLLVENFP